MTEFILLILKILGCVALWLLIVGIIYVVLVQTLTLLLKILNNIKWPIRNIRYWYEAVKQDVPEPELKPYIDKHSQTITKIDWRSICQDLDYDPPIDKEPVPSVKIVVKK